MSETNSDDTTTDEPFGQLLPDAEVWHFPASPNPGRDETAAVDGDTLDVTVDLGFQARRDVRLRLYGVDAAEIYGVDDESDEYARGMAHTMFIEGWLDDALRADLDDRWPLRVYTLKDSGKYGRYLADIVNADGESLVAAIHAEFGAEVQPDD